MKIKSMKCPSCDASLKIKPGQTEGVCEYCKTPYVIDDEVIRIEKKTTVELKLDNNLEIAMATLDNFKDYQKSEILFRRLIHRYGHKKEVYIGLVRSITHDFKRDIDNQYVLYEANNFWEKYKSLATKKEANQYEESMYEMNKKFWHKTLIHTTGNFNVDKSEASVNEIEEAWNNYLRFCDNAEKQKVETKYENFIKKKKTQAANKKRTIKLVIIAIIAAVVAIFLIDYLSLTKERPSQKTKEIKASVINENCSSFEKCSNTDFVKEYFKDSKSKVEVREVVLNIEKKKFEVNLDLSNRYGNHQEKYEFDIVDDMGPFISSTNCTYKDTETFDVNTCYEIYDLTEGKIDNKEATVDTTNVNFKIDGTKTIKVTATDKDGNTETKDIDIIITKTPITLTVNLASSLVVGNTTKLTYAFNPNTIPDKTVELVYDKQYVSIDKNNNVKGLKKGTTEICVISKYDGTKECKTLNLTLNCTKTVVFNFSGGNVETIVAGQNFCTGTYKVYAEVVNRNDIYRLRYTSSNGGYDSVGICKYEKFFDESGKKLVFTENSKLEIPAGIKQVRLVKVS